MPSGRRRSVSTWIRPQMIMRPRRRREANTLTNLSVLSFFSRPVYTDAEAAQAFERVAHVHFGDGASNKMLNEPDDAARSNDEASKQYRLAGMPGDAIRTLHRAADYWYAKGNVTRAAQARGALGEWLSTNGNDKQSAMEEFVAAAEYYLEDQKPAYVFCYSPTRFPPGYNPSTQKDARADRQINPTCPHYKTQTRLKMARQSGRDVRLP